MLDKLMEGRKVSRFSRQVMRFYKLVDAGELYAACEYGMSRMLGSDVVVPVAEMLYDELTGSGRYNDAAIAGARFGINNELVKRAEVLDLRDTARRHEKKAGYLLAEAERKKELAAKLEGTWKQPQWLVLPSREELEGNRRQSIADREREGIEKFRKSVAEGMFLSAQHIAKTELRHRPEYMKKAHMLMLDEAVRSGDEAEVQFVMNAYHLGQQDLAEVRAFVESDGMAAQGNNQANNNL